MIPILLGGAQRDLEEITEYYDTQSSTLGDSFESEFYKTLDRIVHSPEAWQLFSFPTRRALLNRFPYGILYRIEDEMVLVLSIMHLHRDPHTWLDRAES